MRTSWYLNRTLCDVLSEMRKCNTTRNYSYLEGLIEEAQMMGDRMEAALGEQRDIKAMQEEWHSLRKQIKGLQKEKAGLVKNIEKLKESKNDNKD